MKSRKSAEAHKVEDAFSRLRRVQCNELADMMVPRVSHFQHGSGKKNPLPQNCPGRSGAFKLCAVPAKGHAASRVGLLCSRIARQSIAQLPCLGIGGIQAKGHVHRIAGFGEVACLCQLSREIDPGINPGRSRLNRHLKMLDGSGGISAPGKQVA